MKLIYRGYIYHYDPSKAPARDDRPSDYQLHYRGVTYQVAPKPETVQKPNQSMTHQLIYRDNVYSYDPFTASVFPVMHYRDVTYRVVPKSETVREPIQSFTPTVYQLHYRGVTYQVSQTASGDAIRAKDDSTELVTC